MLMTNYTQPINWTNDRVKEAYNWLQDWYRSVPDHTVASEPFDEVVSALNDDLNTWEALSFLNGVLAERRRRISDWRMNEDWLQYGAARFKASANLLGFMNRSFPEFLSELNALQLTYELDTLPSTRGFIDSKVAQRTEARKAKNWSESDRIRDELAAMGI